MLANCVLGNSTAEFCSYLWNVVCLVESWIHEVILRRNLTKYDCPLFGCIFLFIHSSYKPINQFLPGTPMATHTIMKPHLWLHTLFIHCCSITMTLSTKSFGPPWMNPFSLLNAVFSFTSRIVCCIWTNVCLDVFLVLGVSHMKGGL